MTVSDAGAGTTETESDTVIVIKEEPRGVWGSCCNADPPKDRREDEDGCWVFWVIVGVREVV